MKPAGVLLIVLLAGCSIGAPYTTTEIPDLGLRTPEQVFHWINTNITYVSDKEVHGTSDEWQLPHETYLLRTGDCEDQSLLVVYILSQIGHMSMLEVGFSVHGPGHAWVSIGDQHYEYCGNRDNGLPDKFPWFRRSFDLETATGKATYRAM
jgi:hypothetical protein